MSMIRLALEIWKRNRLYMNPDACTDSAAKVFFLAFWTWGGLPGDPAVIPSREEIRKGLDELRRMLDKDDRPDAASAGRLICARLFGCTWYGYERPPLLLRGLERAM